MISQQYSHLCVFDNGQSPLFTITVYCYTIIILRMRSVPVGCPKMGSNTFSRYSNSDWASSGFMVGREGVVSAAKQRKSRRDRYITRPCGVI